MKDFSHLHALEFRLHNERQRLNQSYNKPSEWASRLVIVQGIEREIQGERIFLGLNPNPVPGSMDDDALMAELGITH